VARRGGHQGWTRRRPRWR
jgi:hypothetical protein